MIKPFFAQKAFSLVEIILVVFIVGFMVLFIANIPSALKIVGISSKESVAKEIALKTIEEKRSQTYDNLANTSDPPPAIVDLRLASLPQGAGVYIISDCPSVPPNAICTNGELVKKLTVKVTWVDSGDQKNVEVTTLISQGGLK